MALKKTNKNRKKVDEPTVEMIEPTKGWEIPNNKKFFVTIGLVVAFIILII
jgi:hypothetical protein